MIANDAYTALDERYFTSFLPLQLPTEESASFLAELKAPRTWVSRAGTPTLVFLPPPAKVKDNPKEKPERLGRTIKRLGWCYQQSLDVKIKMAMEVIDILFEATPNVAVAFSGGRDSLVALHLTLQRCPDITVMLANTGIEFPESLAYMRKLAKDWNLNFHEARAKVNFWELTEEQGLPVAGRGNTTFMRNLSEAAGVKLSNSCCRRMKETPARQFYRENGIEGVITGLRVEESLMRKLNFADYGALRYSGIYNTLVAWPLYAWKSEDVDLYIDQEGLPKNPLYQMGYGRVGCWPCLQDMFYEDSRLFTLRKVHSRLYHTVQKKFGPQLRKLFTAWIGMDQDDLGEEDFELLYRSCMFDVLEAYREDKAAFQPHLERILLEARAEGIASDK